MWRREDVKMRRYEDEQMWRCEDVKMKRYEDEQMWRCEDEQKMWRWEDVKMWRCEDEKMWRWEDVKMRRCEDEQLWRLEDVKMRRCEDVKMWRWEDVKMWRCEDEKMWRWEDVKMRRCEDEKMWRWEDVKMRRWETDPHYWKNPALRRSRELLSKNITNVHGPEFCEGKGTCWRLCGPCQSYHDAGSSWLQHKLPSTQKPMTTLIVSYVAVLGGFWRVEICSEGKTLYNLYMAKRLDASFIIIIFPLQLDDPIDFSPGCTMRKCMRLASRASLNTSQVLAPRWRHSHMSFPQGCCNLLCHSRMECIREQRSQHIRHIFDIFHILCC